MRLFRPPVVWGLLILCVATAWLVAAVPAWHVQPFRPQTDDGMAWSFALRRHGPWATAVLVAMAVGAAWVAWPMARRLGSRVGLALLVGLAVVPAWFVRQNHFEWMFAPLAEVAYAAAGEVTLDDGQMVMGVGSGAAAVAFPIRQLAYHHIVNTEVADEPVVATY